MIESCVEEWHELLADRRDTVDNMFAEDVTFYSPVVFSPQQGRALTETYVQAAAHVFRGDGPDGSFSYTKEVIGTSVAMLEFETVVDGVKVNGVDVMRCNDSGRIDEFRVFIRPLSAVVMIQEKMSEFLRALSPVDAARKSDAT